MKLDNIGVVGGGAWGTALAQMVASDGSDVLLWARETDVVAAVNDTHANPIFLPNLKLSSSIRATTALSDMADCDALLLVVPAQFLRGVLAELPQSDRPLILCAKGIEAGTRLLISEVAAAVAPAAPIAVVSGPTFAHEVAAGQPTAVTLACADGGIGAALAARLGRPTFRPYLSDDVIGAEIGGAVKNVLAIGCGVAEGAGLGLNARASLISRGFAEMGRFGQARGARAETLAGLSGLGDLVLTATSKSSRNFSYGVALGAGMEPGAALAEGVETAPALVQRAHAAGVELPIAEAVADLVTGALSPGEAVLRLLSRKVTVE